MEVRKFSSEGELIDFANQEALAVLGHYQSPICHEWEENFPRDRVGRLEKAEILFLLTRDSIEETLIGLVELPGIYLSGSYGRETFNSGLVRGDSAFENSVVYGIGRYKPETHKLVFGRSAEETIGVVGECYLPLDEIRMGGRDHRVLAQRAQSIVSAL